MRRAAIFGLALLPVVSSTARASDHANLDDGLPTEIVDARVTPYGATEAQALTRVEVEDDGTAVARVEPRLEVGVLPNTEMTLRVPTLAAFGESIGLGRVALEALYNINQETVALPSFSLAAEVEAPSLLAGPETRGGFGFDPSAKLLVSKTVPYVPAFVTVHLNGALQYNADQRADERLGRYRVAAGSSFRILPTLHGIVDVVREQQMKVDEEQNLAEVGVRWQATPLFVVLAGAGAGFSMNRRSRAEQSPCSTAPSERAGWSSCYGVEIHWPSRVSERRALGVSAHATTIDGPNRTASVSKRRASTNAPTRASPPKTSSSLSSIGSRAGRPASSSFVGSASAFADQRETSGATARVTAALTS